MYMVDSNIIDKYTMLTVSVFIRNKLVFLYFLKGTTNLLECTCNSASYNNNNNNNNNTNSNSNVYLKSNNQSIIIKIQVQ